RGSSAAVTSTCRGGALHLQRGTGARPSIRTPAEAGPPPHVGRGEAHAPGPSRCERPTRGSYGWRCPDALGDDGVTTRDKNFGSQAWNRHDRGTTPPNVAANGGTAWTVGPVLLSTERDLSQVDLSCRFTRQE